ncbi:protein FAM151B isoform X5 [Gallus gallus]|uniref:protein FAM151B isoform X5 n=1 Tax=Gallus gallus TaxID=9031 RepID=UPI001EFFE7D9|nr:protein FAM151B isoform X5 [Gallus gallus]XP_046793007.1 protein FAM151B isoform X5 [Gallus gallus]
MAAEQSAVSAVSAARPPPVVPLLPRGRDGAALRAVPLGAAGAPSEAAVEHFLKAGRLAARDGAEIRWWHAANSRRRAREAARSAVHMVEADVLLRGGRGGDGDPIMAHPPETDSDITLQEWLEEMAGTDKGIKLDFKSYRAECSISKHSMQPCEKTGMNYQFSTAKLPDATSWSLLSQ